MFPNLIRRAAAPHVVQRFDLSMLRPRLGAEVVFRGSLHLDVDTHDLEAWLLRIAGKLGMKSWKDVERQIKVPKQELLVLSQKYKLDPTFTALECPKVYPKDPRPFLQTALILSKAGEYHYRPDAVPVLTLRRLSRTIYLGTINPKAYYGVE